jgi:flagellar protein FliL
MSDLSGDALVAQTLGAASGEGKGGKGSLVPLVAAVGILTVVALAGGAGVGWLVGGANEAAAEAAPKPDEATKEEIAQERQDIVLRLQPLVTNIASPSKIVVRIQSSIVVRQTEVPEPDVLAAQIEGDTVAYLRTIDLAQIEGSRGLLHLREDLTERAKIRSAAVSDYLIESLVAQ